MAGVSEHHSLNCGSAWDFWNLDPCISLPRVLSVHYGSFSSTLILVGPRLIVSSGHFHKKERPSLRTA
jgi:hypothetical protein